MENSHIEWTDHTWNPWSGCQKVSEGCKFCYMHRDKHRWSGNPQAGSELKRANKHTFEMPLRLQEPGMVFTCSMSDFFEARADAFRAEAWEIIKKTPHLTYQILTKRAHRITYCLPPDWGSAYPNVWLGVSVESDHLADRMFTLMDIPSVVRFVSFEPMIERLFYFPAHSIDWIIIGGESGNNIGPFQYRPSRLEWFDNMVYKCEKHQIPLFVKQLGTHLSKELGLKDRHGRDINEFPEHLKVRQMPKPKPEHDSYPTN
jgi:protein gp37